MRHRLRRRRCELVDHFDHLDHGIEQQLVNSIRFVVEDVLLELLHDQRAQEQLRHGRSRRQLLRLQGP